jgi:hypothetical protein
MERRKGNSLDSQAHISSPSRRPYDENKMPQHRRMGLLALVRATARNLPFMRRMAFPPSPAAMAKCGGTVTSVSIFTAIIQRPKASN